MEEGKGPTSGLPQIIYSSRTHSQLQQVMRELKACSYRRASVLGCACCVCLDCCGCCGEPGAARWRGGCAAACCCPLRDVSACPPSPPPRRPRAATVASRQHGCLHPTVSTMQSGANQACRALTAKRACKWCAGACGGLRLKAQGMVPKYPRVPTPPALLPTNTHAHPACCRYNGVEKFTRQNPDANAEVHDIEDLARIGGEHTACPFYMARCGGGGGLPGRGARSCTLRAATTQPGLGA